MTRYSTGQEVELLKKYASGAKLGIVEIGLFDGETTKEYAKLTTVPIYGIDPIIPDSMESSILGNEKLIRDNMRFYRDFHFYKDYSYNVIRDFYKRFDLLWIDGSHVYEEVKQDFEEWNLMLEVGGYIIFHDSAPLPDGRFNGWPGPTQLVSELKEDSRLQYIETVETMTVFKKL